MAERLGFQAVYLSGRALSASLGLPDVGLVTLTEFVEAARTHRGGDAPAASVRRRHRLRRGAQRRANRASVRGRRRGGDSSGRSADAQALRPSVGQATGGSRGDGGQGRAAAAAARAIADFVIIARTDARGVAGFDEAVRRARLYVAAGADAIFPEALEERGRVRRLRAALAPVPLLANMTEFGRSPNLDFAELAEMGYRMVLYPVTTLRVALRAAQTALADILAKGHQRDQLGSNADARGTVRSAGLCRLRGARSIVFR